MGVLAFVIVGLMLVAVPYGVRRLWPVLASQTVTTLLQNVRVNTNKAYVAIYCLAVGLMHILLLFAWVVAFGGTAPVG